MKTVAVFLTVLAVAYASGGYGGGASSGGYGGGASSGGGGGYGSVSIPAPACPKNYLFSCQPNLSPAPCSPPAGGYGSAGAYSDNVPTIVNAPYPGYQGGFPLNFQQYPNVYGGQGIPTN